MKKTLIVAQGGIARIFLDTILDKYFSNDYYVVVTKDMCFMPDNAPSSFEFHCFDYTSSFRLGEIIDNDIHSVFLVLEDKSEIIVTYVLIRAISNKVRIVMAL